MTPLAYVTELVFYWETKNIDDNEILNMTTEVGVAEAVETNNAAENFREFEALISR